MLMNKDAVAERILSGETLYLAGDESLLRALPRGNWIGGTIPYFMDETGGRKSHDQIFVQTQSPDVVSTRIRFYSLEDMQRIPDDSPDNGYSIVIVPGLSAAHQRYAQEAPDYPGLFFKNIVGWISGVALEDIGAVAPRVFNGSTGESSTEQVVVLHAELPVDQQASIGILNCFHQGQGDTLVFPKDGFAVEEVSVNGESRNFADYLKEKQIDLRLPLVASYNGEQINASFQRIDEANRTVQLYAPVFAGVEYRVAEPIDNYVQRFTEQLPANLVHPAFSCNCILNFVYSELEGKRTGKLVGPVTFGEIAFQLLNQTMVYLDVRKAA